MNKKYRNLFEPFKINKLEIKNRFVLCPMGTPAPCDKNGAYTADAIEYFVNIARGGTGLLVTGANWVENDIEQHVDHFFPCPTTDPAAYISTAGEMTDRIHAFGSKIFCQLTAGLGRSAFPGKVKNASYVAPSPAQNLWTGEDCKELTTEEVEAIIKKFVEAAIIVQKSGFDGIEVHAVHEGYLLDCFAMELFNKRTDKYGGSLENRLRFATEIVQAVKAACGQDFPVTVRYSVKSYIKALKQGGLPGEDFKELGRDIEEGLEVAKLLEAAGYDGFNADAGTYDSWYWAHPPNYFEDGMYLPLTEQLKKVVTTPVIVAGRMDDPEISSKALADGKIDAVGLARPLLCDPDYVNKLRAGKVEDIRICLSCHDGCISRKLEGKRGSCAINPECGRELMTGIVPATKIKNVMIIGGGPGGMEAARVSAIRGHNVALYEASNELGGNLRPAGGPDFKHHDRILIKWYERQLSNLKVKVIKNTKVTEEMVLAAKADAVFVATGSTHVELKLSGMDRDNVSNGSEVLLGKKEVKDSCAVIGGGLVGCEIALMLAQKGKKVTIVEALDDILSAGAPIAIPNEWMLRDLLEHNNVTIKTKTRIESVSDEGAVVNVQGSIETISVDNVIMAVGFKKENQLYEDLKFSVVEIYNIGDSRGVRNIRGAVWDAYEVARSI